MGTPGREYESDPPIGEKGGRRDLTREATVIESEAR